MLVEDTARTCAQYLSTRNRGGFPGAQGKDIPQLGAPGKLRLAVCLITEWEKGGVFQPEDTCPKTGQSASEVLRLYHPKACSLIARSLEAYGGKPPAMVPVDTTNAMVATVVRRLAGSAGPGGVDSISLKTGCCSLGWRFWGSCRLLVNSDTGWTTVAPPVRLTGY